MQKYGNMSESYPNEAEREFTVRIAPKPEGYKGFVSVMKVPRPEAYSGSD